MTFSTMISDLEQVITIKKREYGQAVLSFSFPWKTISLLHVLQRVQNQARVYWNDPQTGLKIAGFGVTAALQAVGSTRFADIEADAAALFARLIMAGDDLPVFVQPRLLGGFSFRPCPKDEQTTPWDGFPPAYFLLPSLVLTQKKNQTWVTVNRLMDGDEASLSLPRLQNAVSAQLERLMQTPQVPPVVNADFSTPRLAMTTSPTDMPSKAVWLQAVAQTSAQIRSGKFQKAVLSRERIYHPDAEISPAQIVRRLESRYPACYQFWIEPQPGRAFCGATPELLAEVRQGTFATTALAGSIGRGSNAYQDQKLGQQLQASAKNQYEHRLVVENIRARLQDRVENLHGPKQPQLRKLANIQHLETPLYGRLKPGTNLLALVDRLHPTPAMGGVPQDEALAHIDAIESHERGWYAAPVGWLGPGGEGTFAVGIRSAVVCATEITAFAGAGIMATSNPEKEWLETEMKFNPLLDAVEFACHENDTQS